MSLRDNIWLWGQKTNGYLNDGYNLPDGNKMDPLQGLDYFGIKNLCRVKLGSEAGCPFMEDKWLGAPAERLCLSLIGAGDDMCDSMDEILTVAKNDPRVVAAVMDDFVSEERVALYTPEVLEEFKRKLHTACKQKIELWSVLYERDFGGNTPIDRARVFDVTTFWTWYGQNLDNYAENFKQISEIVDDGRIMLGMYMYDFGNAKPLSKKRAISQIDFVERMYAEKRIEGVVLCSNVIADVGLEAADIVKDWTRSLK